MQTNGAPKNTLFTDEFKNNPYPVYEKLRKSDPILKLMFPDGQYGWLISSYDDAVTVLKDPRFIFNRREVPFFNEVRRGWMAFGQGTA